MLRHCTVTAVKTNITPVSCPNGTVWRQDKSGEDRQGNVKPGEDGCSVGCPGMTNLTYRSFVQISPQSIWFQTQRRYQSEDSLFFFFSWVFKLTKEVIIRSSDDGILFLFGESFYFGPCSPNFNLFASQEPALFLCLRKHRHLVCHLIYTEIMIAVTRPLHK